MQLKGDLVKHGQFILTVTRLPIRSKCESLSAFTHAKVLHVNSLLFTAMFTISTVVHLWNE